MPRKSKSADSIENNKDSGDAWYTIPGKDDDVVLSLRVRLARNLANFPFPVKLNAQDSERIMAIVFDSFNSLTDGDKYQTISVSHLDELGSRILKERGILESTDAKNAGIIVRNDGKVSCGVNIVDHIRLASFSTGFDINKAYGLIKPVDDGLQERIQFAASYDFGYLTSNIQDAGSGLKLSIRFHLPCLSLTRRIRLVNEKVTAQGCSLHSCFGAGPQSSSLGAYYELSTLNCLKGSEVDQITNIAALCMEIVEMERAAQVGAMENLETTIRNIVYRSVGLTRSSLFISVREAIDIISGIKLGKNLNLLKGVTDTELNALLFRIQDGHLEYVLKNGNFNFESEVSKDNAKKNERLRALILQEAFEKIELD